MGPPAIVGPPAKRLRVARSPSVDPNDSEFARKQQEAQEVLKNSFESIFAKYETMSASKSDVICMKTGKILLNNGHLEKLEKDKKNLETTQFIGDFLEGIGEIAEEMGDLEEDSADELAPSEKSVSPEPEGDEEPASQEDTQLPVQPRNPIPTAPTPVIGQMQLFNALFQPQQPPLLPQTPQQPQEPQTALLASIGEAVGQAVRQALTQLIPQAFSNQPGITPINPAAYPPVHMSAAQQNLTPATDPKWYFPPLPEALPQIAQAQSSPIPVSVPTRKRRRQFSNAGHGRQLKSKPNPKKALATSAPKVSTRLPEKAPLPEDTTESELEGLEPASQKKRFPHGRIPTLGAPELPVATPGVQRSRKLFPRRTRQALDSELLSSPTRQRQLPTPSSSAYSEGSDPINNRNDILDPPHPHSEEDLDLLSLAGDEDTPNAPSAETDSMLEANVPSDEIMLPLIETEGPVYENFKPPAIRHPRVEIPRFRGVPRFRGIPRFRPPKPATAKQKPLSSPKSSPRGKQKAKPMNFTVDSDSDEIDLVPVDDAPEPEPKTTTPPPPSNYDLPDELDAPFTPHIKRESATPGPSSLLTMPAFKTPKSAPQLRVIDSPASKSTSNKLSKHKFEKMVRAQWAKRGGTPHTVRHRPSLQELRTRQEDSEDELA